MAKTSKTKTNPTTSKVSDPLKAVGALTESQIVASNALALTCASHLNLTGEEFNKLNAEFSGDKSFVLDYGKEYKVLIPTDGINAVCTCNVRGNECKYLNLEGGKRLSLNAFLTKPQIDNFKASEKAGYLKVLPKMDNVNWYTPIEKCDAAACGMLYVSYSGKCERFDAANNIKLQDGRLYLFSIHE